MVLSSIRILIFSLSIIIAIPVDGFSNTPVLIEIPRSSTCHKSHALVKSEKEPAKDLSTADRGTRLYNSNFKNHCFQNQPQRLHSKRARKYQKPSSLVSSQLFNSASPIHSSTGRKTSAVYLLILASLLSFVGDNILHVHGFHKLYLYHRNWSWWQPVTSTFCHGDKTHLSGNIFLLLLFGRSVEDEVGAIGLLFSYFFCGVIANFVSLVILPKNTISVGASGAVFGLFSVSIFSRLSWRDILDWRKVIEVGVLGQFVVERFLNEAKVAATGGITGVNHVAHLAGAGAGIAMVVIMRILINIMEKN